MYEIDGVWVQTIDDSIDREGSEHYQIIGWTVDKLVQRENSAIDRYWIIVLLEVPIYRAEEGIPYIVYRSGEDQERNQLAVRK